MTPFPPGGLIPRPPKVKAEDLLKNMFPNVRHVAALVRGKRVVDHLEDVTIMFSDLKGYTQWASEESPKEVYRVLNKVSRWTTAYKYQQEGVRSLRER